MIEVINQKLGERLTFDTPLALVIHLWRRLQEQGHYTLTYDDVTVRASDGWTHTHRGDYVLLHALAGVPIPGVAAQPGASIAEAVAGRQQS